MGAEDLTVPGHIFPLRAMDGGVLRRAGHTEAAVDLARLAGCYPAGVICEVLDEHGDMARLPELTDLARRHGLKMITIKDLIEYRTRKESLVRRIASTRLPTEFGEFTAVAYEATVYERHPPGSGHGRRGRRDPGARAHALRVLDRRRLPVAALRLRLPAAQGDGDHQGSRGRA